jgi:hypothetical protein
MHMLSMSFTYIQVFYFFFFSKSKLIISIPVQSDPQNFNEHKRNEGKRKTRGGILFFFNI